MRSKRKLLLTAAFTALLGIGAFTTLSARGEAKAEEVDATYCPSYIYLKWGTENQWYWWSGSTDDDHLAGYSTSRAHFWIENGDNDTDLGNVSPTAVDLNGNRYAKFAVPSGATNVMWYMNGWGTDDKSVDQTIPSDGHNLFVFNTWNKNLDGYWDNRELSENIESGFYVRGDWGDDDSSNWGWREGGQHAMVNETDGTHTYSGLSLGANGRVKIINYVDHFLSEWITPDVVTPDANAGESFIAQNDENGNTYVNVAGVYNLRLYWDGSTCHLDLTGGPDTSLDDAIAFATDFTDAMKANCPYTDQDGSSAKVVSAWKSCSDDYAALSTSNPGALVYLAEGESSTVDEIIAFASSYDYVYGHYAGCRLAANGGDFAGRNPSISASYSPIVGITVSNGVSTIVIVAISVASLTAVAGYFYFRKRKEN